MCDTDERVEEMLTSECLGEYGYDEVIYLTEDIFLPALIGVTTDNCAVYSYNTIIEILMKEYKLSEEDVIDHADFNIVGSRGDGYPIYLFEVDGKGFYEDAMRRRAARNNNNAG